MVFPTTNNQSTLLKNGNTKLKTMKKDELIEEMLKDMGDRNNIIDLNAYGRGLIDMYDKLVKNSTTPLLGLGVVGSRLFAVMADEYVILKLFWEKEDADKELDVCKREHKDALFFVEKVDVH